MDPANAREALREVALDVDGGRRHRDGQARAARTSTSSGACARATDLPVAAYNVSGEYAMLKAAAAAGLLDERAAVLEALTGIRRAGADIVITYHAKDVARWLQLKVRSRKDGAAIPLDETDKRLLNLLQGSFALIARGRSRTSPSSPGIDRGRGDRRASQRLLDKRIIREITPIFDTRALGYQSMLVAAKVDAEYPHRAAKVINSHPGVTHNYLRNHDFNLWFTLAVEPDSPLGHAGHARRPAGAHRRRVDPPAADAEAVQDPHGPRDGRGHRRAVRRPSRPPSRSSSSRSR